ncbi:MAG: NapC/NirT family cytochrome c [Desulfobulbaceae bacterium]|nr:NapC/NirT family cytochrome c [Desulfobulbaceae bacterium]
MSDTENMQNGGDDAGRSSRTGWGHIIRGMWRTPLGVLGVAITTVSITLMLAGLVIDILGLVDKPYAAILTYMILPGGMVTGLLLIPLAAYLRRREWHRFGVPKDHLVINLSDHKHRRFVVGFFVLTVINFVILAVIGYEGYHFTDSPYFCGMVCHEVMAPEYTVYQRSAHAKVACVECHIGPGAEWFVQAKISGLRQVVAVMTGSFSRPIPAPVTHLRPARDTCEHCHWPDKFHGKKVKTFNHFTNDNQSEPETTEISLHIGGRNPKTDVFEGIHWHVSKDVKVRYLATDEKRTQIARVQVTLPDGTEKEFVKEDVETEEGFTAEWRTMDCIDCHNRPTHTYDKPADRVDFGLLSRKINSDIVGIREDCLTVITKDYASRDDAASMMGDDLLALQAKRSKKQAEKYKEDILNAADFLLDAYLGNVWPKMNVAWGTYKSHLGHQDADAGFGCWRCHDEEHQTESGEVITQDCSLCHDEPE